MTTAPDITSLRSVGLAYRQLSASLAEAYRPWYRAETLADWHDVAFLDMDRLADDLFRLDVLEHAARRIYGATRCPEGKDGCPPEWVRSCDWCCR